MKLLFCNEGPLYIDEYSNYYSGALNDEFFEKYYQLADYISICIRTRKISSIEAKKKYTKLNLSKKQIIQIPDLMSAKGIIRYNQAKRILSKEIEKNDIVVARVPSIIGNIAAGISKRQNKICIADVVGCPWDSLFNHSLKGKMIAVPMFFAQRKTVKNANYSIYVTERFLQKRYPTKNESIGLSDVILEETNDRILENRLDYINGNKEKIILGTIAAINVKYKGQQDVIKALAKLKKNGINNIEYQLVGGGNPSNIQKIAKKYHMEDRVIIKGALPHDKVFEWLDTIDIYIQPSYQEGLCRALIEAMSRGVPCIASDVGGNSELLSNEWIYDRKKSISQLVDKLIIINNNDMIKMAKENFEKSKKYQKEYLKEQRNKFYDKIIKGISIDNRI